MEKTIYKRAIIDEILPYLDKDDILVLLGARQVGKTHILYYLRNYLTNKGEKTFYIDLEDARFVSALDAGVDSFLTLLREQGLAGYLLPKNKKKIFVFIDEIQYLAEPSSFLKLVHDHQLQIKLIVSGSSSFEIKNKFKNSLVGRTLQWEIFNLSFAEFLNFRGVVGDVFLAKSDIKIAEFKEYYQEFALYGGYPKIALTSATVEKEKYLQQIIDTYIKKDIRDLAAIKEVTKFNKLLEALASQSGSLLNSRELSLTCGLALPTVANYLFLLENTYIIKLVTPYSGNKRSELFKTPKIFFYDSGLAQMLWLKSVPKKIIGSILETSVFAELVKKYGKDQVHYWRTTDKKEIDFILSRKNKLVPIEVKTNFQSYKKHAMESFMAKYKIKDYKVAALEGLKNDNHYFYPWEL